MDFIVGLFSVLIVIAAIVIGFWKFKPCPREQAGYTCRKEKGQKCECEE